MFATDYPHSESWFPKSVDVVLGWTTLPETTRRKLLWDNAARCYRRCRAALPTAKEGV
jgi:predicted TIM-barrel fold metal-dependent hydrolase